jgi:aminopeptidase
MKALRITIIFACLFIQNTSIVAQPVHSPQSPIDKYANVLINYSLEIQPGETILIVTKPEADELSLAVYREALLAGGFPLLWGQLPGETEIFFRYANENQLRYQSQALKFIFEHFNAFLQIDVIANTKELNNVNPERLRIAAEANEIGKIIMERWAKKEFKWCYTTFPTNALAQEAEMGLIEYREFVYDVCQLNSADPAGNWKKQSERQHELTKWLQGRSKVVLKGSNIDLSLLIDGRTFMVADGKVNFPDGEIFTSPIENSANGWVRFSYPAIYNGQEVNDVELWFKDGKVVKETAEKGQNFLTEMLNTDDGARILGEFGIGTNYSIKRFTKNMLYDEKIGGTIHLAVGRGFPEIGGKNESTIHWDMLCDMSDGKIIVDNELFYENGKFVK